MQAKRLGGLSVGLWTLGLIAAPIAVAIAAGGGGGGGGQVPSVSEPQYNPAEEYEKGQADFQAGRFKDAAREFEHVTDATPRVASAWYMLGLARARAGDAKGATKALATAIKRDGEPVAPHRDYALALIASKQADKANAELTALKARAGQCGDACPQAGELKAAIDAIQTALAAPTAQIKAAGNLLFASQADGDGAYVRAVSLINERRYDEALIALRAAERVFGPHPDVLTYEGYTWRKLGQLDRAESYYQAALAIAPEHRGATEYYGELKVIRGDVSGAKAMLARLEAQCTFGCVEAEELRRWIDHGGDPAA